MRSPPCPVNVLYQTSAPRSEGGFGLEIALAVSLPGIERAKAETLVAKAHEVRPYSNATRNNIDVKLSAV